MRPVLLSKESYEKTFKGLFEKFSIDHEYILQTKVDLPFEMPVPDGYVALSQFDSKGYWSLLYFSSVEYRDKIKIFDNESYVDSRNTVVNLCVVGKEFSLDTYEVDDTPFELSDRHSYFFNNSLSHLNAIITAYLIHFQDENVFELTMYDLNPICGYELVRVSDWTVDSIAFVLHHTIDVPKSILTMEEANRLGKFSNHIIKNDYMFLLTEKYLLMSKNKLNVGQFSESVIFAQVAVELKIKRLFYYFLQSEGATEDKIIEVMENTAFSSMVKKEMPSRLGGVWDMTKPGFPISEWYVKCYSTRNHVVHAGYTATKQDAQQAVAGARVFILYITDLIREKKKKYPELMKHVEIKF